MTEQGEGGEALLLQQKADVTGLDEKISMETEDEQRPLSVGQPCYQENQSLWWWDLPPELQLLALQVLSIEDIASASMVSKGWLKLCSNNLLWEALYLRDHGQWIPAPEAMEIDECDGESASVEGVVGVIGRGSVWMQRYRDALSVPQWDRRLTNEVLVLSKNDRWAQRNGSGAFPKAISVKPVGVSPRPILLTFRNSIEFGLFSGRNGDEIMADLNSKVSTCHWPDGYQKLTNDCVFFTKMGIGFYSKLSGTCQTLQKPIGLNTDFGNPLKASLSISRKRGEALWILNGERMVTPLPSFPFYLVYSTGCSYGRARIHVNEYVEDEEYFF